MAKKEATAKERLNAVRIREETEYETRLKEERANAEQLRIEQGIKILELHYERVVQVYKEMPGRREQIESGLRKLAKIDELGILGQRAKSIREDLSLSQVSVAKSCGGVRYQPYLSKFENRSMIPHPAIFRKKYYRFLLKHGLDVEAELERAR